MNWLKKNFNKWNDISKCPKCGSTDSESCHEDYLDGYGSPLMEYDVRCCNCGLILNHYAYGYMELPETKTGYIKWIWFGQSKNFRYYWVMIKDCFRVLFL
jgi:transcription elongation factor Elf1